MLPLLVAVLAMALLLLLLLVLMVAACYYHCDRATAEAPPNILFILADDLLSCCVPRVAHIITLCRLSAARCCHPTC